jgi:hypothetical protein
VTCSYVALLGDTPTTLPTENEATVSAAGNADKTATQTVSFTQNPTIGYDEGTLTDPRFAGAPWNFTGETISDDTTKTFDETFVCPDDASLYDEDGFYEFTVTNWADLNDNIDLQDDATVTVLCEIVYETAYAKGGDAECFIDDHGFSNWGWTNPIGPGEYTWDLWAGAGQCDTSKGVQVGTVTVDYDGTNVTVSFNVDSAYILGATHVYVDTDPIPVDKKGNPTVAPGQYKNHGPFTGGPVVYVIAHAEVGGVVLP